MHRGGVWHLWGPWGDERNSLCTLLFLHWGAVRTKLQQDAKNICHEQIALVFNTWTGKFIFVICKS